MKSLRKLWRRLRGEEVHTSPFLVQPTEQQTEASYTKLPPPAGVPRHCTFSSVYYTGASTRVCTALPWVTAPAPEPPPAPKTFRAPTAGVETKRSILRDE